MRARLVASRSAPSLFLNHSRGRGLHRSCRTGLICSTPGPNHAQSRSLLLRMIGHLLLAGAESIEAGVLKLDLHGLTAGAAEMVVRWWLLDELPQRLKAGEMKKPTRVMLVTGHGESRVLKEAGVVKQRVLEVVNEFGTVVEQSNLGCVVLTWPLAGGGNTSASV